MMSEQQLSDLLRAANPVPNPSAVTSGPDTTELFAEIERRIEPVERPAPWWRAPEMVLVAAAAAVVLVVGIVLTLGLGGDEDETPVISVETTVPVASTVPESTVPVDTTVAPPPTPPPTTVPATAPPTTLSPEEEEFLALPTWGTSGGDAGTYRSFNFTPRVSFTVPDGWERVGQLTELPNGIPPFVPPRGTVEGRSAMFFYRHGPPSLEGSPTPDAVVDRLRDLPGANISDVEQTMVGGIPATRLRFEPTERFVYITMNSERLHGIEVGEAGFAYVFEVDGETVSAVMLATQPDQLELLDELARPILETFVWHDL